MGVGTERLQQQYMLLTAGPSLWPLWHFCSRAEADNKQNKQVHHQMFWKGA